MPYLKTVSSFYQVLKGYKVLDMNKVGGRRLVLESVKMREQKYRHQQA